MANTFATPAKCTCLSKITDTLMHENRKIALLLHEMQNKMEPIEQLERNGRRGTVDIMGNVGSRRNRTRKGVSEVGIYIKVKARKGRGRKA